MASDTPHRFTVNGAGNGTRGWYTVLLAKGGAWTPTESTEHPDRIEQHGLRASGKVQDTGKDTFRFGGVIIDAKFSGNVGSVEINGKRYDPNSLVEQWQRDAGVRDDPKRRTIDIPDDHSKIGPRAGAHSQDRSGWDSVDLRDDDPDDLATLVPEHGSKTVIRLWSDQTLDADVVGDFDDIAIVGKGTSQTTLHVEGTVESLLHFGNTDESASGIHLRNLDIDVTNARVEKALLHIFTEGEGAYIKDVRIKGELQGPGNVVSCETKENSVVDLERLVAPAGASRSTDLDSTDDSIGVIHAGSSDGTLRMEDCELGGFPNNGIYASGSRKQGNDGHAYIIDHTGYDSDRDQVRVGGESLVVEPELFADEQKPGYNNLRGVWFRFARDAVLVGGSIRTHHSDKGEAVRIDSTAGRTTVQDVDIECASSDHRARGVLARKPTSAAGDDVDIEVSGCSFHGDGSPRDVILVQEGRGGSVLEDNDIDVPNADEEVDFR